jgi:hypothetical protein
MSCWRIFEIFINSGTIRGRTCVAGLNKTVCTRESFDILRVKTPIHCALLYYICFTGTCFDVWDKQNRGM